MSEVQVEVLALHVNAQQDIIIMEVMQIVELAVLDVLLVLQHQIVQDVKQTDQDHSVIVIVDIMKAGQIVFCVILNVPVVHQQLTVQVIN